MSMAQAREQELQKAENQSHELALGKQRRVEMLKREHGEGKNKTQRQHVERLQKLQAEAAMERERHKQMCAEKIALAEQQLRDHKKNEERGGKKWTPNGMRSSRR